MSETLALVFTCEHASPAFPALFRSRYRARLKRIPEHRVFDRGASGLAIYLAKRFDAPLHRSRFSRLLVDLNRSPGHPGLFSEISRGLRNEARDAVLSAVYGPYRDSVTGDVDRLIRGGTAVVHVSVHTFTPVWRGARRPTEVGLLFDPSRSFERRICVFWRRRLKAEIPGLAVHFNRPYRGRSDGLTAGLRKGRKDGLYAGIEIEVNQKFFAPGRASETRRIRNAIGRSLAAVSDLFDLSEPDCHSPE
jgi:predicted N-formylglutamate amidohydrolase